ncbi:hypothetical protein AVEN_255779-1, partial [Araneus ventricosus]
VESGFLHFCVVSDSLGIDESLRSSKLRHQAFGRNGLWVLRELFAEEVGLVYCKIS